MGKLKVCFLCEYYHPAVFGGAEISIQNMAQELAKRDIEVHVLTPNYSAYKNEVSKKGNLTIYRFKSFRYFLHICKKKALTEEFYKKKSFNFYFTINQYMKLSAWEMANKIKEYNKIQNFDIVNANNIESTLALARAKLDCVKIGYLRDLSMLSMDYNVWRNKDQYKLLKEKFKFGKLQSWIIYKDIIERRRKAVKKLDYFIAINEFCKESLATFFNKNKILVIYDYINLSKNKRKSKSKLKKELGIPEKNIILFVGSLVKIKGAHLLPKLARIMPKHNFVVLGDGPLKGQLVKNKPKNLFLMGNVKYEKVIDFFQASDVFINMQTIHAGFGMTTVEAMWHNTPVVSFEFDGIDELITHEKTGMLSKMYDLKAIKKNIEKLFESKHLRNRILSNAKQTITKKFSFNNNTAKLLKAYKMLVK